MPIRRSTDPLPLQHVWDAIRSANCQKQMADHGRIIKYLQRVDNCTSTQAELYLKQTVDDGLVIAQNKTAVKGVKVGSQVETYKIPSQDVHIVLDDYKDWYCIDCHLAGDVTGCRMCHRAFHDECANKKQFTFKKNDSNNRVFLTNKDDDKESTKNIAEKVNEDEVAEIIDITNDNDSTVNNNVIENSEKQMENCVKVVDPIVALLEENCQGYDLTLCSICNMCKLEHKGSYNRDELNYLLAFVENRIKSWLPPNISDTMSEEPKSEWLTESEIVWRSKLLFYHPISMSAIENKLKMNEYTYLVQFKADVLTIQHNVAIYHGIESQEYGASEYMLEDCRYDLAEISNCPDCYKHSNEKIHNKWFCLPCRVPHKLVWAKQKGYPYWPAKVMKESESTSDVRFFGGKYERSILPNMYIKPISTKISDSHAKKSSSYNKAVSELLLHQKMLNSPPEARMELFKKKKLVESKPVLTKNQSSKKPKKVSLESDDDLFNKTAQALEDSLSAQSASLQMKRKRSTSPFAKAKLSKTPRRASHHQVSKNKLQSPSPKNGISELSTQISTSSNGEDEFPNKVKGGGHEEVTSSTEQFKLSEEQNSRDNTDTSVMPETERQYSESVEKTRRKLEQCRDKKQFIKISLECMQAEIDRINNVHDDYIKRLFEIHSTQVSETKKKQWCFNCEQDAIYHCCWNTAYCSPTCQQQHWQAEHKKVCRRKR